MRTLGSERRRTWPPKGGKRQAAQLLAAVVPMASVMGGCVPRTEMGGAHAVSTPWPVMVVTAVAT